MRWRSWIVPTVGSVTGSFAAFDGQPINEQEAKKLIKQGKRIIEREEELGQS